MREEQKKITPEQSRLSSAQPTERHWYLFQISLNASTHNFFPCKLPTSFLLLFMLDNIEREYQVEYMFWKRSE
jgi:hypothetical protein